MSTAIGWATCLAHRGQHVWNGEACIQPIVWSVHHYGAIVEGMRHDVLMVCVAHRGAHAFYLDQCHGGPAPGLSRHQRYLRSRDPSPEPPPPIRVEIDEERLAAAIVAASRATREERRLAAVGLERVAYEPPPDDPPPSAQTTPPLARPASPIPTVTVWTDDGSGPRAE
jgi:hypothetical protein